MRDRRHAAVREPLRHGCVRRGLPLENEQIAFNAGSHTEVIKLAYKDFERLAKPKVVSFTT